MAAGKLFHWRHGWIPVSPQAKAFKAGNGPNPTTGALPDKDAAKRARRADSLNRTADKRAVMEQRYAENQNRKAGVLSTNAMISKFRGDSSFGSPPQTKIADRVQDGKPFLYEPGTGKVSRWSDNSDPQILPGTERTINPRAAMTAETSRDRIPAERDLDKAVQAAVEDVIKTSTFEIQNGAKVGGTMDSGSGNYRIGLVGA